jgi:membrane AbrB-like protein
VRPARDSGLNPLLALLLCAGAGAAFAALRLPLPWMIGPLLAMAACNFAGAQLRAPRGGRALGQVVIGTALGLYFTPVVGREVIAHWPLLLLAAAVAVFLGVLGGWILSRASGVDSTTAFFASVPGGAAEMTLLGERFHARPDRVALAQSLRILVVVIVVPFALTYSGAHGSDSFAPAALPLHWQGLAVLLAIATAVALLLDALGMPNAFMFGPLAITIGVTVAEVQFSSLPGAFTNSAQVLIGCALGARFERRSLESAPRYVAGVLASIAAAIAVAVLIAAAVALLAGLSIASLVLAMAPGGIAEMCITAQVLQLGVPLVTAAHVARVVVLIVGTAPGYRAVQALRAWLAASKSL